MRQARLQMVGSMLIFGTLGLFVRQIPVSSAELALYRAVLAAILIMIYLLISRQRISFRLLGRDLPLLLGSGIAMGINWILLFEAYRYTSVSVATLSYYFAPVIVMLVCPLLFREKQTGRQKICFMMSASGLILLTGASRGETGTDWIGICFGLGAAVFYASVILLNKYIRTVDGIQRTFLQFIAAITVLLPYTAVSGGMHLGELTTAAWICLLLIGIVHTGLTYCMYFSALKELSGQKAAILSYIDPLTAVIISVLFLHEHISVLQAVGGMMILGFTCWNELPERTKG